MNRFEKPNEAPSGASCEEKKHRGGSPRIDACQALRVFLRPSRRWNRGGFESGSRRREGQRIKKLRPPGLRVITAEQHLPLLNRPHRRGQFFKGRTAPRHLAALAFAVSRPFGNRSPNRTCRSFGQTAETDGCRSAFFAYGEASRSAPRNCCQANAWHQGWGARTRHCRGQRLPRNFLSSRSASSFSSALSPH